MNKTVFWLIFIAGACLAQPPVVINPGSPVASAVVNSNFSGLYNGRLGRWSGTGAPGSFSFSILGDIYVDTAASPPVAYFCARATFCNTVASGNWQLIGSGGGGGGVSTISGSGPSWLTWTITNPTTTPAISLAPTTAQTSHQVIGTCNAATIFQPCLLVAGDLPNAGVFTGDATTTWPALTITKLNGITPGGTCVNMFVKVLSGSAVPTCAAVALGTDVTGNLAVTHLCSGTGASGTTFLRGDCVWATPAGAGTVTVTGGGTLTNNAVVVGNGLQIEQTPCAGCTLDSSGNLIITGTATVGNGSANAGADDMVNGTVTAVAANSVGFGAPATVTTSQRLQFPNAVTTAHNVMVIGAPASNISTFVYKAIPDCQAAAGNLNFTQSTDNFSCSPSLLGVPFATPGTTHTMTNPSEIFECSAAPCTITMPLPLGPPNTNTFCVLMADNVAGVITFAALGTGARYETTARTGYGTAGTGTFVSSGVIGDMACIIGKDATHYETTTFKGTWVAN